jgi:GntR family transcriptional regulator
VQLYKKPIRVADLPYHPFPKYLQIRAIILRGLSTLKVGDKLPAEEKLADHFSVTRLTIRQSLKRLEEEGIISRRAGVGTWLAKEIQLPQDQRLTGPIETFSAFGLSISARTIHAGPTPASEEVADKLQVSAGTTVFEVHRLRIVDGEPLLWLETYMPIDLGEKISKAAVDGLFVPVLQSMHDPGVSEEYQVIEAVSATEELASVLGVKVNDPILSVNRLFVDTTGRPVVFFKTRFRSDRYFYTVNLPEKRRSEKKGPP